MSERTLFARKATGLVREIGFTTAVVLAIANVVGLGWQKKVFQAMGAEMVMSSEYFLGIHPMIMAFFLVGIVMLLSIYTFAVLTAAMPRSGGGYVFMSRILNPSFAFVATCLEFFAIAVAYGVIAVAVYEATLIYGAMAGIDLSRFYNPWFMTIFGVVIIAFFSAIAALGARMTGYLLHIIFWIPAAILVLVYLVFLMASPANLEAGLMNYVGHSPLEYTQAALAQGMVSSGNYWSAVFTASFFAYWAYIGYAAATFVAGEVKEASKSMPKAIFTSGILIALCYMTISFLLVRAGSMVGQSGGYSFLDAIAFLDVGGGDFGAAGLPNPGGWMPSFAGFIAYGQFGVAGGRIFGWLILAFAALWVANDIPPFILSCSRMMFSFGFDRILPEWVADINEKWASPVNAIIVTSVAALVGVVCEAELFGPNGLNLPFLYAPFGQNWLNSAGALAMTDGWDALFFSGVALSCFFFPSRMPEVFDRAPWRQSKTIVQILAIVAFCLNVALLLLLVFHPSGWGFGPLGNWLSLNFWYSVALALIALVVFFWGRSRAQREGADLTTIFAEIPPE